VHNTLRRLLVGGAPVATGLHALGDAVCTTNPTLGRGLSVALRGAADLVDTLEAHGEDWTAQALVMDALVGEHMAPFYEDQAAIDRARLAALRHTIFGAPVPGAAAGAADARAAPGRAGDLVGRFGAVSCMRGVPPGRDRDRRIFLVEVRRCRRRVHVMGDGT